MKSGQLIIDGVVLQPHEVDTINLLIAQGKKVSLVRPSLEQHVKNPDIAMDGLLWEMKSPKNAGKYTIEHAMETANKQSENLIMDLRRSKIPEAKALTKVKREAAYRKGLKRVLAITKHGDLLDIK